MSDTPENTPSIPQPEVDALTPPPAAPAPAPIARPPAVPRPVAPVTAAKAPVAPKFVSPMPKIEESDDTVPSAFTVIAAVAAIATIAFAILLFLKKR